MFAPNETHNVVVVVVAMAAAAAAASLPACSSLITVHNAQISIYPFILLKYIIPKRRIHNYSVKVALYSYNIRHNSVYQCICE